MEARQERLVSITHHSSLIVAVWPLPALMCPASCSYHPFHAITGGRERWRARRPELLDHFKLFLHFCPAGRSCGCLPALPRRTVSVCCCHQFLRSGRRISPGGGNRRCFHRNGDGRGDAIRSSPPSDRRAGWEAVINLSVRSKQISPVLAALAVMLAGRVGGAAQRQIGNDARHRADRRNAKSDGNRPDPLSGRAAVRHLRAAHADADGVRRPCWASSSGWLIAVPFLSHSQRRVLVLFNARRSGHLAGNGRHYRGVFLRRQPSGLISCYRRLHQPRPARERRAAGHALKASSPTSSPSSSWNFVFAEASKDMYIAIYGIRSVFG